MKKSIALRLSFWICLFLAIVFIGLTLVVSGLSYKWIGEWLSDYATTLTSETAAKMDRIFLQMQGMAYLLSSELETSPKTKDEIAPYVRSRLARIRESCSDIIGLAITYKPGMLEGDPAYNTTIDLVKNSVHEITQWRDEEMIYEKLKDWFIIPMTKETPFWSSPFVAVNGAIIATYSVPFYQTIDGKRTLAGVVVLDYEVDTVVKYLKEIDSRCCSFVVDPFGRVTASTESDDILNETLVSLCETDEGLEEGDLRVCREILGRNDISDFPVNKGHAVLKNTRILKGGAQEVFYRPCVNKSIVIVAVPVAWRSWTLFPIIRNVVLVAVIVLILLIIMIYLICRKTNIPLMRLSMAAKSIGAGDFNVELPDYASNDEVGMLTDSFGKMQLALNDYVEKLKKSVVMEGEINAARNIQKAILPEILPDRFPLFKGFENIKVAADLIAAHGVGGDLFDVFPINNEILAVIIGDVSGKGVPAALFMAITQTLQRTLAKTERTPSSLVSKLNEMLARNEKINLFVTYWVGFINKTTGELLYTDAGHNPPLVRHKDGTVTKLTERHGPPIGVMGSRLYGMQSYQLQNEDILVCYTDGVTEATNKDLQMLGDARLEEVVSSPIASTPLMLMMSVRDAVFEFTGEAEQYDDVTIVATQIILPSQ